MGSAAPARGMGVLAHLSEERYRPLALDLPGHGDQAGARRPITFDGCMASVLDRSPERFVLAGYSMGGRHRAARRPGRARAGAAAGADRGDSRHRGTSTSARGGGSPTVGSPTIWKTGRSRSSSSAGAHSRCSRGSRRGFRQLARADQRRNRPEALAAVLRGVGTGEMPPLWERLGELEMPVTVVVGDRDIKFQEAGRRMVEL